MYHHLKLENVSKIKKYQIGSGDGTVDFYPRQLQIEHTTFCNASCIMCNHFFLGNHGAAQISSDVIRKLEPILPYCQLIMMNGDGEPFMNKNLGEYISLYKKYEAFISTNTNLCAVTHEQIKSLFNKFNYLNISCDGIRPDTFEYIRRGLHFDKFMDNLTYVRSVCPSLKLNLDYVVMSHNLTEIPSAVEFAKQHGFASIQLNLMESNPLIGNETDSILNYPEAAAHFLMIALRKAEQLGIRITMPFHLIREVDSIKLESELADLEAIDRKGLLEKRILFTSNLKDNTSLYNDHLSIRSSSADLDDNAFCYDLPCSWAIERCYIDIMGNVSTCCFNVHHYMGNLLEIDSFDDIWNGENYKLLRRKMGQGFLPQWCRGCRWITSDCGKRIKGDDIPVM